jgi:hypothetical protein
LSIAIADERLDSSSDLLAGLFRDPSDPETNDIAAANSLSRTPLWRKHLEMYPGTHTKTPKGNLSREVAFRNVGKDLSDNNESYRVWRQASDYENNGCSNRNPSGQLILALSVKLTIRLFNNQTATPAVPFLPHTQICEPEVRFSSILFLYLVGKIRVDSETNNLKNIRRL